MPNLSDITNAASYRGDANLGGAGALAIQIDTKPIQQLAAYTLMYNKSQYDQRQKDADEKIKKLGSLAPYDLINGIEKDATELKDAQAKLTEEMAAFAAKGTPKSPKEKIQQDLDFQQKISGQVKLINAANARKIKLDKYREATQSDTKLSAQEKELRIKQAEKLFNDTDINTLPEIPNHDLSMPKNGDPIIETVSVLKNDKNGNAVIQETIKQFSIGNNWKSSYMDANNLSIPTLPQNATQQQKNEYEQKKLAYSKTDIGGWQSAAEFYNVALLDPNYKKTVTTTDINVIGAAPNTALTDEVDIETIKSSNPIVGGIISLAERYNNYATKRLEDIKNGYYIDTVTGEKVLLTGGDKAEDIKFIDVAKPLKPEVLSFLDKFAKAAPDQIDKKLIETDDDIQNRNITLDYKVAKQNADTAWYNATNKGEGTASKGEPQKFMDLTGADPKQLTTADIAALDPTLTTYENGLFKLNSKGESAVFDILPNGDVKITIKGEKEVKDSKGKVVKAGEKDTEKLVTKTKYQGESVAIAMTVLKDRKGEEGNPFTFTGKAITTTVDDDSKLTDAEYFMKHKKPRPKK